MKKIHFAAALFLVFAVCSFFSFRAVEAQPTINGRAVGGSGSGGGITDLSPFEVSGNDVSLPGDFAPESVTTPIGYFSTIYLTNGLTNVAFIGGSVTNQTNLNLTASKIMLSSAGKVPTSSTYTDTDFLPQAFATLTDGATVTLTCVASSACNNAKVTIAGNRTLAISGATSGMYGTLEVIQDGSGSHSLALPANSKVINGGGGAITLTTTALATDILTWTYDGTNFYWNKGLFYN